MRSVPCGLSSSPLLTVAGVADGDRARGMAGVGEWEMGMVTASLYAWLMRMILNIYQVLISVNQHPESTDIY